MSSFSMSSYEAEASSFGVDVTGGGGGSGGYHGHHRGILSSATLPSSQVAVVRSNRQKVIYDPIWGDMCLDRLLIKLIDTSYFQRLRHLKQLGTTYFVFPGASHNRFEHSLGTAHLAGQLVRGLLARQPELGLTERDVLLVSMAGLCHDLGHGPFSHVFDNEFLPAVDTDGALRGWKHEAASEMMLDAAIHASGLDDEEVEEEALSPDEITFVKQLINPPSDVNKYVFGERKRFLYEIVSNSRNSIDVDKFDYLARDARNSGVSISIDVRRLMNNCRVIGNQICYHRKVDFEVYKLFQSRYEMFKQIYSHRTVKAVEYMVRDALIIANGPLDIVGKIGNADSYLDLDDRILALIAADKRPELAPARELLRRIDRRDIYRCVFQALLPAAANEVLTPKRLMEYVPEDAQGVLAEGDLIVEMLRLNYAKKDLNPVDHVRFFDSWDATESFPVQRNHVSLISAQQFQERYVRVYIKDNCEVKAAAAKEAANSFLERVCEGSVPNPPVNAFALTQDRLASPSKPYGALSRTGSMAAARNLGRSQSDFGALAVRRSGATLSNNSSASSSSRSNSGATVTKKVSFSQVGDTDSDVELYESADKRVRTAQRGDAGQSSGSAFGGASAGAALGSEATTPAQSQGVGLSQGFGGAGDGLRAPPALSQGNSGAGNNNSSGSGSGNGKSKAGAKPTQSNTLARFIVNPSQNR